MKGRPIPTTHELLYLRLHSQSEQGILMCRMMNRKQDIQSIKMEAENSREDQKVKGPFPRLRASASVQSCVCLLSDSGLLTCSQHGIGCWDAREAH